MLTIDWRTGGHINHTLFWENLAPTSQGGGEPPSGPLAKAIDSHYGSLDAMKEKFNTALAGIQGSGWAWLVQDTQTGAISIKTYANQDPVVGQFRPLVGVDAWEHAYYLDYQNRKAEVSRGLTPSYRMHADFGTVLQGHLERDQLEGGGEEIQVDAARGRTRDE